MPQYRELTANELVVELFDHFERKQVVTDCKRKVDGEWTVLAFFQNRCNYPSLLRVRLVWRGRSRSRKRVLLRRYAGRGRRLCGRLRRRRGPLGRHLR